MHVYNFLKLLNLGDIRESDGDSKPLFTPGRH